MKQRNYRIGPGAASLLLVIVVIGMSVLGILSLIDARSDYKLTQSGKAFTVSEMEAMAAAQHSAFKLDAVLYLCAQTAQSDDTYFSDVLNALPEGMRMEKNMIYWIQRADSGRILECCVEVLPQNSASRFEWRSCVFVSAYDEDLF